MGRAGVAVALALALTSLAACGASAGGGNGARDDATLTIGAIPDQDPEELQRLYPLVANYLSKRLGVRVAYKPVTDYAASVIAFKIGDLQLVWFGGLTSLQAINQVPGARPLAQRDIDTRFHSLFIANRRSGLRPIDSVSGLRHLSGHTFTYGSQSSTSGRLMPEYFIDQAGLSAADFNAPPGYSGSHDATIAVVESGSFDAGALNEQVFNDRLKEGRVDRAKVSVIWRTPAYHDYRWVARPDLDDRFGPGFTEKIRRALLALDAREPQQRRILELFGAQRFVATKPGSYRELTQIARKLKLLGKQGA